MNSPPKPPKPEFALHTESPYGGSPANIDPMHHALAPKQLETESPAQPALPLPVGPDADTNQYQTTAVAQLPEKEDSSTTGMKREREEVKVEEACAAKRPKVETRELGVQDVHMSVDHVEVETKVEQEHTGVQAEEDKMEGKGDDAKNMLVASDVVEVWAPGRGLLEKESINILLKDCGLFRVAPIPNDQHVWVGCKFCPMFGATTRKSKKFFMLFRTPFDRLYIAKHMKKEHGEKWNEYKKANAEKKDSFFEGVKLPDRGKIVTRALVLGKSWDVVPPLPREKKELTKKDTQKKDTQKKDSKKRKGDVVIAPTFEQCSPFGSIRYLRAEPMVLKGAVSSDEMWAGRRLQCTETAHGNRKYEPKFERQPVKIWEALDLSNLSACFENVAGIHSAVMDVVLSGVLSDEEYRASMLGRDFLFPSHSYEPGETSDKTTEVEGNKMGMDDASRLKRVAVFVLFHLLRGISLDSVNALMRHVPGIPPVAHNPRMISESNSGKAVEPTLPSNGVGSREERSGDMRGMDTNGAVHESSDKSMATSVTDSFTMMHIEENVVWNCGNSICAEALKLLRQSLSARERNWAILLLTRHCDELGHGAIEVLVQTRNTYGVQYWIHLVSVRNVEGAGGAVVNMLDCVAPDWHARLVGLKSGLRDSDTGQKKLEQMVVETLQKEKGTESGLFHAGIGDIHPVLSFRDATGPEVASLVRANKQLYSDSAESQELINSRMDQLTNEERWAEQCQEKVFAYTSAQNEHLTIGANSMPEAHDMLKCLYELWSCPLPLARDDHVRYKVGWFGEGSAKTSSSAAVNPLLERVLFARGLVVLHVLCAEDSRPNRSRQSVLQGLRRVKTQDSWGTNWSYCEYSGEVKQSSAFVALRTSVDV